MCTIVGQWCNLTVCVPSVPGYSGADMANLCREAAYGPVREAADTIQHIAADAVWQYTSGLTITCMLCICYSPLCVDAACTLQGFPGSTAHYSTQCVRTGPGTICAMEQTVWVWETMIHDSKKQNYAQYCLTECINTCVCKCWLKVFSNYLSRLSNMAIRVDSSVTLASRECTVSISSTLSFSTSLATSSCTEMADGVHGSTCVPPVVPSSPHCSTGNMSFVVDGTVEWYIPPLSDSVQVPHWNRMFKGTRGKQYIVLNCMHLSGPLPSPMRVCMASNSLVELSENWADSVKSIHWTCENTQLWSITHC